MTVTAYRAVTARHATELADAVASAITDGYQPQGSGFYDPGSGLCVQPMVLGSPTVANLNSASAAVANGDTVAVHNSAGADSHNATAEVSANSLTDVKFAATVAMVDNADTVVVKNSAGTTITGTHTAEVASGVLSDVKLASSVAFVLNGGTLTGVAPSGSYTNTITFTVAAGVITAIVLS